MKKQESRGFDVFIFLVFFVWKREKESGNRLGREQNQGRPLKSPFFGLGGAWSYL